MARQLKYRMALRASICLTVLVAEGQDDDEAAKARAKEFLDEALDQELGVDLPSIGTRTTHACTFTRRCTWVGTRSPWRMSRTSSPRARNEQVQARRREFRTRRSRPFICPRGDMSWDTG